MSTVLRITGLHFDVDRFVSETGLKPYLFYRIGENIGFKKKGKDKYETNGCSFDLSNAVFDNFEKQIKDTIDFLTTHFDKLMNLSSFGLKPNDIPVVDFAIESDSETYPVQSKYLPPELLKLTGKLSFGVVLSLYDKSTFGGTLEKDDTL